MIIIFALVLALILLDVVAIRWGKDSTEPLESQEWEHRQHQTLG